MNLLNRWCETWRKLAGVSPDMALFDEVIRGYSEPSRKYHDIHHLAECFSGLDDLRAFAEHPAEIELALWFHDAIYDVHRHDNESLCADLAKRVVLEGGFGAGVASRVHALVMVTRHAAAPLTMDEKIMVDVDLGILGANPSRFDEYERAIRAEYDWVPDEMFRSKRKEILEGFIARPFIYFTERFRETHESLARENLTRSISALSR